MKENNTDWRLISYDGSLDNKEFDCVKFISSQKNDHEHCEMCFIKITDLTIQGEETIDFGYKAYNRKSNQTNWLCPKCFNDFCERFHFKKAK